MLNLHKIQKLKFQKRTFVINIEFSIFNSNYNNIFMTVFIIIYILKLIISIYLRSSKIVFKTI